jgi:GT2 family glycosyltransferase
VTIVVPVYGHLPSLLECVRSIKEHADLSVHKAILVNDVGPEADEIETALLAAIEGIDGIVYYRNPQNLGFVGTCNRAAYELDASSNDILLLNSDAELTEGALDEMVSVLYASEKHAVVCPRSNQATIATIPFRNRSGKRTGNVARTLEVFKAVKDQLPRFTISPVSVGFSFLVRRSVIDNHNLFDSAFAPGYGEENDFCLRVSDFGYSAVLANRALVLHEAGMSFDNAGGSKLKKDHEAKLWKRYPFYPHSVDDFLSHGYTAIDHFADILVPHSGVEKKILIDLHHLSLSYDGTSRNALSFLELIHRRKIPKGIEFTVAASPDSIEFFKLKRFGVRVIPAHLINEEVFDVGFALAPLTTSEQLLRFNRLCAVWVISHLDVIALRSWRLRSVDWSRKVSVQDSLAFADRVVTISDFSADDVRDYFDGILTELDDKITVIPQGRPTREIVAATDGIALSDLPAETTAAIRSGGYVLVMGNGFAHKQVKKTLGALSKTPITVVALGDSMKEPFVNSSGQHVLPSGKLAEKLMDKLFKSASLVVFPSAYEGFGLPIAEAAYHGKKVLAFDTRVAREVAETIGVEKYVSYFDNFALLSNRVQLAMQDASLLSLPRKSDVRTLDVYNSSVLDELLTYAGRAVDVPKLVKRWDHFMSLSQHLDAYRENDFRPRISIFGLPSSARLGSNQKILVSVEGIKDKKAGGEIAVADGSTELAVAAVRGGQASFSLPLEYPGKRGLKFSYRPTGSKRVLVKKVLETNVAPPRSIKVKGLPADARVGAKVTVKINVDEAARSEVGTITVRDGSTVIGSAESRGGRAAIELNLAYAGHRFMAVEYETVPRRDKSWGSAVISVDVTNPTV